jgi:hypothetical protein
MGPLFLCRLAIFFRSPIRGILVCCLSFPVPVLEATMQDVHQILREKEVEIAQVRQEIAALRLILPLLADDEVEMALSATALHSPLRASSGE